MKNKAINIQGKFDKISSQWTPKIITQFNNCDFRIVKIEGEFIWHHHDDTDEVFIVIEGEFNMEFRDHIETVKQGEMIVVEKNTEHRPVSKEECKIMLIELSGTMNTGNIENDRTKPMDEWI